MSKRVDAPCRRAIEDVAQVDEPGKRGGAPHGLIFARSLLNLLRRLTFRE